MKSAGKMIIFLVVSTQPWFRKAVLFPHHAPLEFQTSAELVIDWSFAGFEFPNLLDTNVFTHKTSNLT